MLNFVINALKNIKSIPWFFSDYFKINKELKGNKDFKITKIFPILSDKKQLSGSFSMMYFNQDLFVAKRIYHNNPKNHVDIWSRVDWFVAHVASYRDIEVFDIRPSIDDMQNIKFVQADLMKLPHWLENYTDSISSLSVIEHFWLGRYGDPIDVNWHIKGLNSIYKILKKWWKFYFSAPIWPQRIEFNAHRIFDISYLIGLFENKYSIDMFSYLDDKDKLHENITLSEKNIKDNFWCNFGCGIFELTKI